MKDIILKYLLLFSCLDSSILSAQSPGANDCGDSYSFCSLEEMNGFTCSSKADIRGCRPLCTFSPGPVAGGRHWWSFIRLEGHKRIYSTKLVPGIYIISILEGNNVCTYKKLLIY